MWHRFKADDREYEWQLTEGRSRRLDVRSVGGDYHVQCLIQDNQEGDSPKQIARSWVLAPTIVGAEFPRGSKLAVVPISLEGGIEIAEHGIIHTEFVRSLLGRWENRTRYKWPTG